MSAMQRPLLEPFAGRSATTSSPLRAWFWLVGGVILGVVLYFPFGSIQYDLNGVAEAVAVEQGGIAVMRPNHMLYGVGGRVLYTTAQALGYSGNAVPLLKLITAFAGAATVGIALGAFHRLSGGAIAALLATLFLATSWAQWVFSTDVYYITVAAAFTAGALLLTAYPPDIRRAAAIGALCACAILTWQACIFLAPLLALGQLWLYPDRSLPDRARMALVILLIAISLPGCTYLLVGIGLCRHQLFEIFGWVTCYEGARLPIWGRWSFDRILPAGLSALSSLIPIWSGLGMRDWLNGTPDPRKLPALLSLPGLIGICGLTLWRTAWRWPAYARQIRALVWLLCGYLAFLPFIIWWDPFEPKWFVVPNLFLAALLAVLWSVKPAWTRLTYGALGLGIAIIGFANFHSTIWPRAILPNPNIQAAACVAQQMQPSDLLLETNWSWGAYVSYFHGRDTLSMIDLAGRTRNAAGSLDRVAAEIRQREQAGGKVYIEDLDVAAPAQREWFTRYTGIDPDALQVFEQHAAYQCGDYTLEQLTLSDRTP